MVKNGFSSLIRGIFYTIGKMIAFILIGLLIGFLAVKFNVPIKNLVMLEAHAQENLSGAWTFYDKSTFHSVLTDGYDSTISGISYPSSTYSQIPAANLSQGTYHVGTALDIQANHNFVSGTYYTLKYHFDFGSYIYPLWPNNNSQSWFFGYCPGSNCTLTYQWQGDSSHQTTSYLDLTINFRATSNSNSVYFTIGNFSDSLGTFYNAYTSQQGIRISTATIDSSSSGGGNQDIIDNDNQNTQNIINNNNQNTTNIINNQNENTEKEIESQKVCTSTIFSINNCSIDGYRLGLSGNVLSSSNFCITDYLPLSDNISISIDSVGNDNTNYCFYDTNKNIISCSLATSSGNITIPGNAKFFRSGIYKIGYIPVYNVYTCKNGNQALSDDINDLENRLFDHSVPDMDQVLEDLNDLTLSDTPITDLLLLPLRMIQAFVNGINGACTTIDLGTWEDTPLYIPCINIENYLGSTLWGIIDLLFCGFMALNISQLMIHDFDSLSSAEDLFDETYTPKHNKVRRSDRYD